MGSVNTRWGRTDSSRGADYDARWSSLAAGGQNIHREADLVGHCSPVPGNRFGRSVLDAGCGTGRGDRQLLVGVSPSPGGRRPRDAGDSQAKSPGVDLAGRRPRRRGRADRYRAGVDLALLAGKRVMVRGTWDRRSCTPPSCRPTGSRRPVCRRIPAAIRRPDAGPLRRPGRACGRWRGGPPGIDCRSTPGTAVSVHRATR